MREAAAASTRLNEELDLATLDEGAFARLTRRAFSHYGDLSRLGASPLTRLPRIDARLAEQAIPASTLNSSQYAQGAAGRKRRTAQTGRRCQLRRQR